MAYSRWEPLLDRTAAFHLFKRHHTHLNSLVQSFEAAKALAVNAASAGNDIDHVRTIFPYAHGNPRLNISLKKWKKDFEAFDRWTRHAYVLAINGYLETFFSQICSAAVESCPALIVGGSREIEGVAFLKADSEYDFREYIRPICAGSWKARAKAYRRLFKTVPFSAHISDLDKMRRLRNNVGHTFGRDIEMLNRFDTAQVARLRIITQSELVAFLALAERVALSVDHHLSKSYVGNYEIFLILHRYRAQIERIAGLAERVSALNIRVNDRIGSPCGNSYARTALQFYNSL